MQSSRNRIRRLEREAFHLDISKFEAEELVELTRLLIRKRYAVEITWQQSYFLTYRSAFNRRWCRNPPQTAQEVRAWFRKLQSEVDDYHDPEPHRDVSTAVWQKLSPQLPSWEHFVRQPNWTGLFSHGCRNGLRRMTVEEVQSDADLNARWEARRRGRSRRAQSQ